MKQGAAVILIDKPYQPRSDKFFATNSTSQPDSSRIGAITTLMVSITTDYISAGGNRHPTAADWDVQSGVLAYGADNNVALWDPRVCSLQPWMGSMRDYLMCRM